MFSNTTFSEPLQTAKTSLRACPICAGPCVEQRNQMRCLRCGFMFCQGCESDGEDCPRDNGE